MIMKKGMGLLLLFAIAVCYTGKAEPTGSSEHAPSNSLWTTVIKKYVNQSGLVNYKGLLKDRGGLNQYLSLLSSNPPSDKWSVNEKKAYWINAYNAFTVKLILDHYPVKSIKDIGPAIQIPFVNTPWSKKFFKIGGEEMKLDQIEHDILRKKFNDPRIHFSLVCASRSCPKLRNEAYEASSIDQQLDDQGRAFLADKSKNIISADKLQLSKVFSWFKGDFTKNGSLIDFLNKFSPVRINKNADIDHLDYNWNLNEQ
jgi:hypothetical protein